MPRRALALGFSGLELCYYNRELWNYNRARRGLISQSNRRHEQRVMPSMDIPGLVALSGQAHAALDESGACSIFPLETISEY